MTKYAIDSETLTDIADAIRTKMESSDPIAVSDFATEITSIPTGGLMPTLVSIQGKNRSNSSALSYTFTTAGKYQYYILITDDGTPASSAVTITLNGTALTPTTNLMATIGYYYDEITVNANDVISVSCTTHNNRGLQFMIFQNADITRFAHVGATGNDNSTFTINLTAGAPFYETYRMGYYSGNNYYYYIVGITPNSAINFKSIPTPNESMCWYGGTIVFAL